jgi:hypothetical protein
MIFYHFTQRQHLLAIQQEGLTKRDVGITMFGPGLNGVWLTTDNRLGGHGLTPRTPTDDEFEIYAKLGNPLPADFRFPNRQEMRIKIKLTSSDRNLKHWIKWSRKHVSEAFRNNLIENGGGKHNSWYVYFGTINPDQFVAIDDMERIVETQRRVDQLNASLSDRALYA